jgi:hypothetical protein
MYMYITIIVNKPILFVSTAASVCLYIEYYVVNWLYSLRISLAIMPRRRASKLLGQAACSLRTRRKSLTVVGGGVS